MGLLGLCCGERVVGLVPLGQQFRLKAGNWSSRSMRVGTGPVRAITCAYSAHGGRHGRIVAVDEQRIAMHRVRMVARQVDFCHGVQGNASRGRPARQSPGCGR